jgi:hypothetical protein
MILEQVEAILGGPPRREAKPATEAYDPSIFAREGQDTGREIARAWYGSDAVVVVFFRKGKVDGYVRWEREDNFLKRIRHWFRSKQESMLCQPAG